MKLEELGRLIGAKVQGDGAYAVEKVVDVGALAADAPVPEGAVAFVENKLVLKKSPGLRSGGAVLTTAELAGEFKNALVAEGEPRVSFIRLLRHFDRKPKFPAGVAAGATVDPSAKVDPTAAVLAGAVVMAEAVIGPRVVVWPGAVIEPRAVIGEDSEIRSSVVIGYDCVIGKRCIIHSATAVGADGFGFFDKAGERLKIPQIGNVVLEDDVELGASNTVDRAAIASTVVGRMTKTDDQVHIGHNCRVGKFCYIVGNTALGGSVTLGDGVMLSGMVIVKDHVSIGAGSIVMGASGVAQDLEPKSMVFGIPTRPAKEMHRINATLPKLPELVAKVAELEALVREKTE